MYYGNDLRFLQDTFWRERILGARELEEGKIRERMNALKLKAFGPFYCVVIFAPYLMKKEASKIDALLSELLEQIQKAYDYSNIENYMISDDYCNVVGVFSLKKESDYRELCRVTRTIAKKMIDKHDLEMFVGVGKTVDKISLLGSSKNTAAGALAHKFTFSHEHVIVAKDVQRYYDDVGMELKKHYDRVLGCFYDDNINMLTVRFHELSDEIYANSSEGLNTLRNVCIELTATLLRFVREMGLQYTPELDGIYTHIAKIESRAQVEEWFVAYCSDMLQKIKELRQNKTNKFVEQAENFIINNIQNIDLNIQMISDYVGLSAAYFGEIFYREKGIHVGDYISRNRIEEAKNLLCTTNKKITQISEMVGFTSPSYFNTVFKRYVGVTPKRFRENKMNLC